MLAAAAASVGHPAVAAVLGLGAAGLAGSVVAMAWNVHARQIRLAELLARRQFFVPAQASAPDHAQNGVAGHAQVVEPGQVVNGNGVSQPTSREAAKEAARAVREARDVREGGAPGGKAGTPGSRAGTPGGTARAGPAPPVIIEGPETVVIGEQARYRVRPSGSQKVVSWAAGGGSVSQSADPDHPDELLLTADQPGNLIITVRLREGLAERRETKTVTALPDPEVAVAQPVTPRVFLHEWGLIAVAILVVGFAGSLVALGSLASSDFIALVAPLAALLGVIAVTRVTGSAPARNGKGASGAAP
jgi:hypothetical protein